MDREQAKELMREVADMSRRIMYLTKRKSKLGKQTPLYSSSVKIASIQYEIDTLVAVRSITEKRAKDILYPVRS